MIFQTARPIIAFGLAVFVDASALLAAPPDLPAIPAEADYSPALLRQWTREAGLANLERLTVESIAAKWERQQDAWRLEQESRIVVAMERTWELPVGSAEREAAALQVASLQIEKAVRWNRFVDQVRELVRLRGKWPTETARKNPPAAAKNAPA